MAFQTGGQKDVGEVYAWKLAEMFSWEREIQQTARWDGRILAISCSGSVYRIQHGQSLPVRSCARHYWCEK